MTAKTKKEKIQFGLLLGLLGAALLGSVWAWFGGRGGCASCGQVQGLLGGPSLAALGVGVYGLLLALGVTLGGSRILFSGILLAASAHAVLLVSLFSRGMFCAPCALVGGAAILGGILSLFMDPDNLGRGSILIPLGVFVTHAALIGLGGIPHAGGMAMAEGSIQPPLDREHAAKRGTASLLVFTRAGCRYCEEFEEQVLPGLVREFGKSLEVRREAAPGGMPSPTLVVGGAVRTVFPGLPPGAELRSAILLAMGRGADEPAVLSQSR